MQRHRLFALAVVPALLAVTAGPALAAPPQLGKLAQTAKKVYDVQINEEQEIAIGKGVSEKVRQRYGVVQDPAIHRYVSLVGMALAQVSSRPNLPWTFIVLDTDGVNAFAAPGGYVHITRGALALMNSEAELAGVLGHEMIHATNKHTIKTIQSGKYIQLGAEETIGDQKVLNRFVDKATELILAGYGRKEELESDQQGIKLASRLGYKPQGLETFLRSLESRNKNATEKQGLFASHPEMNERLEKLSAEVTAEKLTGDATLEPRYRKNVTYKPKAQTEIAGVEAGAAGLTGGGKASDKSDAEKKDEEQPKKKRFGGLASLVKPTGSEKKSAEVTGSGASRGVDTERNAKGGSNPALVEVAIKPADVAAFKKEGNLK